MLVAGVTLSVLCPNLFSTGSRQQIELGHLTNTCDLEDSEFAFTISLLSTTNECPRRFRVSCCLRSSSETLTIVAAYNIPRPSSEADEAWEAHSE